MLLREAKRVLRRAGYRIDEKKIGEDDLKDIVRNITNALDDEFQKFDDNVETEYSFRTNSPGQGRMSFRSILYNDQVIIRIQLSGISVRRSFFTGCFSFGSEAEMTITIDTELYGNIYMRPIPVKIDNINYKNFAKQIVARIVDRIDLRNYLKKARNELQ